MLEIFPRALKTLPEAANDFLRAGDAMAERIRAFDWSRTSLGPIASWPAGMRNAVRALLEMPHAACLWWGEARINLPNAACLALLAPGHATSLGVPARAAWGELWRDLEDGVERAAREGIALPLPPLAIPLEREGVPAEAHFSVTLVPVFDGDGRTLGVLGSFDDATAAVVSQREATLVRAIVSRTRGLQTLAEAGERLAQALATDPFDVPFSGLYLAEEAGDRMELRAASGIAPGDALMPRSLALEADGPYPAGEVLRTRQLRILPLPERPFGLVPTGPWSRPPQHVALVPLGRGALWVAALNPFRALDDAHRQFLETIAAQLSAVLAEARLNDAERRRIESDVLEREVRAGDRRYRELLEALPAAIYTTDADGRLLLWNRAASSLWGREPLAGMEKYCGAHLLFTPEGEKLPDERSAVARLLRGEAPAAGEEVVIERPDGSVRHVLVNAAPLRDEHGALTGAVNMLVDISARRASEAELAATKDELAAQVEGLTMLHELAVKLGGMDQVRPALQAVVDTAVEAQGAVSGLVWLHDPRTGELVVEAAHGFEGDRATLFTRVSAGADGGSAGNAFARRTRWVVSDIESDPLFEPYREAARAAGFRAVHSTPIITRGGELLGVVSVHFGRRYTPSQRDQQVADVCARHAADALEALRSQAALRESERLYRAIGESINYGVWTADVEGRGTYVSDSFLQLLGLGRDQVDAGTWEKTVHPDDWPLLMKRWQHCVATGAAFDHEFRVRCADGSWFPILGRGVPVRDDAGSIVGWAGINLDIKRLKQVETELRELDQRKDEFLATLAHELRNPLAPLRNGLEVMRLASGNPATIEKARTMMERQLAQMVRLVDDLLDVSRVSRGKIELRRERVELAAILRNAMETSQPLMTERGHDLVAAIPRDRIVVDADVTRLSQVFWNLLNNAARYTEPRGRIELSVQHAGGEVAVAIRDNGIGIPEHMQARVFDIFTQVDRSLEKSQGGLGIGLSIAKRLVEMHGGRITVKSDGDRKGSEFTVHLPATIEAAPERARQDAGACARAGSMRKRILVADDNPDSATTLSLMLEVLGNEVRVVHDGEAAVAAAGDFNPDMILLDIGMPKLNGYGACERIRREPWGTRPYIVALTGWGQEADKHRSKAAGFDRHLVKPVEPSMLEKMIATLPASPAVAGPEARRP